MRPRAWLSWTCVGLLAGLCGLLAFLQNRWIAEFSRAEQERLHSELSVKLGNLSRDFNNEIAGASSALLPSNRQVDQFGREKAYSAQYLRWRQTHGSMFSRIALAIPQDGALQISVLDLQTGSFSSAEWPPDWEGLRDS